jgi:hypothetical protein
MIFTLISLLIVPSQALTYPSHIEPLEVTENFRFKTFYSSFRENTKSDVIDGEWQGILDLYPRVLNGSYRIRVTSLNVKKISLIIYASYYLYHKPSPEASYSLCQVIPVIFNSSITKEGNYSGSILYTKLNGTTWASADTEWKPIPYCSYEAYMNYSEFGYCTFSAQLWWNEMEWDENTIQSVEIEFSYQGFHDPVFYKFLQDRYYKTSKMKQFWKFLNDSLSVGTVFLALLSPFIGAFILIKRGGVSD